MNAALDLLEAERSACRVNGHDLPIEEQRLTEPVRERLERGGDFRKLPVLLAAVAGIDGDGRAGTLPDRWTEVHDGPDAVVLGFVEKALAGRRWRVQGGQHWAHQSWVFVPSGHGL